MRLLPIVEISAAAARRSWRATAIATWDLRAPFGSVPREHVRSASPIEQRLLHAGGELEVRVVATRAGESPTNSIDQSKLIGEIEQREGLTQC